MDERVRLDRRYDWVGPPDKDSKIRPIQLRRLGNETELESKYRNAREELNRWNASFWAHHNHLFSASRNAYKIEKKQQLGRLEDVSDEDMAAFYRKFLNERHQALIQYNREWYKRNLSLLFPALKVNLIRFKRLLLRR